MFENNRYEICIVVLEFFYHSRLFGVKVYVHRGIVARSIHQIFEEKENKPESGIVIHMSYMEIYQEVLMCIFPYCS